MRRALCALVVAPLIVVLTACQEPAVSKTDWTREKAVVVPPREQKDPSHAQPPPPAPIARRVPEGSTDETAEFVRLAAALADPILADPHGENQRPGYDEVYAQANAKLMEYTSLETASPKVRFLAAEAKDAQARFLDAWRNLRVHHPFGAEPLLLGIGILAGNPAAIFGGLQGSIKHVEEHALLERSYAAAFQRNRGAQLSLTAMAAEFAGPVSRRDPVRIDMDESWQGETEPYDILRLQNSSGSDLSDVLLEVSLTGASGETRRNVHFVRTWPAGEWRYARYGMGSELAGERLGQQTVLGIQAIRVGLWCETLKREGMTYTYPGIEKDRDVRTLLENRMKLLVRLQRDSFFSNPGIQAELVGVATIPAHTVDIEFFGKGGSASHSWPQERWGAGSRRIFAPQPALLWNPDKVRIKIRFADTSYQHEQIVEFGGS